MFMRRSLTLRPSLTRRGQMLSLSEQRRLPAPLSLHGGTLLHQPLQNQAYHYQRDHQRRDFSTARRLELTMYNSLSGKLEKLQDDDDDDDTSRGLACYMCGPTVYAPAHLGHARTYVWLDIFRRVWEASGHRQPLFVMNITDVDDKILAAAGDNEESPIGLARRYETDFWRDWDALNCLRPHIVTRVTEHVDSDIIPYIKRLVDSGMAYDVEEDGVYFDVRAYEDQIQRINSRYGKLAPPAQSSDFFDNRYHNEEVEFEVKRDPRDFALWKNRKDGERMYWPSPWGDGRPGWHIECSAMIEAVQNHFEDDYEFAVHAGGVDLQFPHHTNEIAQAEAYHVNNLSVGQEWIKHWVHTGHLHIDGLKMSKSLKNFITIEEVLAEEGESSESSLSSPADDFRLWCLGLSGSYRGQATYSKSRLEQAKIIRQKLVGFLMDAEEWLRKTDDTIPKKWTDDDRDLFTATSKASAQGMSALASDLDGSAYLDAMVEIAEDGKKYLARTKPRTAPSDAVAATVKTLRDMLAVTGFSKSTTRAGQLGAVVENPSAHSAVVGGERALLDELVRFRTAVRSLTIETLKGGSSETMTEVLERCDSLRDDVLPSIGVELVDGRIEGDESIDGSTWKFCLPRSKAVKSPEAKGSKSPPTLRDLSTIPVEDLFRQGPYEGQFSEYDEMGVPTRNADGSEVSNRLRKKLLKKRDKHVKRLAQKT